MEGEISYPRQFALSQFALPLWRHTLFILVGPSASGKSTFAQRHFPATMWVATDNCRGLICDYPGNQQVSEDAFSLFYTLIEQRLANGCATIADSTALKKNYRQRLYDLAARYQFRTVLVLFDLPLETCQSQDRPREYAVGEQVLQQQFKSFARTKTELCGEPYHELIVLRSPEEITQFAFYWTSPVVERSDYALFDIIGDVHGCHKLLTELLTQLGYQKAPQQHHYAHPGGRRAIFVGDIMDRGTENLKVLDLVYDMCRYNSAWYVPGNHCNKFFRYLGGSTVTVNEGLEQTVAEFTALTIGDQQKYRMKFCHLYAQAPPYLLLDHGRLVVVHAGITPYYLGRTDRKVWDICLYGPTILSNKPNQDPLAWTDQYGNGKPLVVYGHIPVPEARWHKNSIGIDLGAVKGGSLAALRYPEKEVVQVKAASFINLAK